MRILTITSQFPIAGDPHRGRPILQTLRELSKLATVRILSPIATYPDWAKPGSYLFFRPEASPRVEGCDVEYVAYPALPLLSRPFNGWLCGRAIRASAQAFRPDVILSYWLYPDAYGALQVARAAQAPLIAGARGSDLRVRDAISKRLTRPVVRDAQRLLVVSDDLARVAIEDYGADPGRIRIIRNGCDAEIFHPRNRATERATLGLPADVELIVYVGRLVAEKGLRELVEAARTLAGARRNLCVALIGDGPLRGELEQAAADNPGLLLLTGAKPASDVARWMAASNLVTLPSWSEGHPNVLVESLACGRPVVATPVGGIPEIVDDDSGIMVPVRQPSSLAEAWDKALDRHWDEAALASKHSRSWAQVACDTLQECERALAGASSGGS